MQHNKALLTTRDLSRNIDGKVIVDGVSLKLFPDETLGFLGLNGAGKSTMLRLLAGIIAPSSGSVHILGNNLADHPVKAKSHIGYLPDHPPLVPDMRVGDYLIFAARLRGLNRKIARSRTDYWLERLSLGSYRKTINAKLSKGYRQRVGLAQALIHDPEVILLDEPGSGLDPEQLREMRELLHSIKDNRSILLSTHQLTDVASVCDRVIVLHQGKLIYEGKPTAGRHQKRRLVRFTNDVTSAELGKIPGVAAAEKLTDNQWAITPSLGQQQSLLRHLLNAGLGVAEFSQDRPSLEALFTSLVSDTETNDLNLDNTGTLGTLTSNDVMTRVPPRDIQAPDKSLISEQHEDMTQ